MNIKQQTLLNDDLRVVHKSHVTGKSMSLNIEPVNVPERITGMIMTPKVKIMSFREQLITTICWKAGRHCPYSHDCLKSDIKSFFHVFGQENKK